jgi:hypothetical protein
MLSQWRGYAGDGTGVSVGFDFKKMPVKAYLPLSMVVPEVGLRKIIYDVNHQNARVAEIFGKCAAASDFTAVAEIVSALQECTVLFKNPAFQEEAEWRLVHGPLVMVPYDTTLDYGVGLGFHVKHRVTDNALVSYYELSFPKEAITTIYLGPQNKFSRYDLDLFLGLNGFRHVTVQHSQATYKSRS